MTVLNSILPRLIFTQNVRAGDPGRRSGTTHGPVITKAEMDTLLTTPGLVNYGDDILVDHTVTISGRHESWGDYASRTIDQNTPRQITQSQLLRIAEAYDPVTMDPLDPIEEEVVVEQSAITEQSALVEQDVAPQGPPSFIRILSDGVIPQRRIYRSDAPELATFENNITSGQAIFSREGGPFQSASSTKSYRYWWFEGLRMTCADGSSSPYAPVHLVDDGGSTARRSRRSYPSDWVFFRCLVEGDAQRLGESHAWQRWAFLNCYRFGVFDCGMYGLYGSTGVGDGGAFQISKVGSVECRNTYIEGAGAFLFTAGTGGNVTNDVPEGFIFSRVHFRRPRAWQQSDATPSDTPGNDWNVTVSADGLTVTRNAGHPFRAQNDLRYINPYSILYDPATGRAAFTAAPPPAVGSNTLRLAEAWEGTRSAPIAVGFLRSSAVYCSGRPGDLSTATVSTASATVAFSAALPPEVVPGQYFQLIDQQVLAGSGTAGHMVLAPTYRRRIDAIAGDRLSCALDAPYNVDKTHPYAVVWGDGLRRTGARVKALFEPKAGRRFLFEDVVLENSYRGPGGSWSGTGVAIHPTNQDNAYGGHATVADVRFRWMRQTRAGLPSTYAGTPNSFKVVKGGRYTFQHAFFDTTFHWDMDLMADGSIDAASGVGFRIALVDWGAMHAATVEHCSWLALGPNLQVGQAAFFLGRFSLVPSLGVNDYVVLRDNMIFMPHTTSLIFNTESSGAVTDLSTPNGWEAMIDAATSEFRRNVLFGPNAPARYVRYEALGLENAPLALTTQVGFPDYDGGDYWPLTDVFSAGTVALAVDPGITTDTFDGTYGSGWTTLTGALKIVSSQLTGTESTAAYSIGRRNAATVSADLYVQAVATTFTTPPSARAEVGVCGRFDTSADTCYMALWDKVPDGSVTCQLVKRVAGGETVLASVADNAAAAGDTFRIEITGDAPAHLVAKRNAVEILTHDDSTEPITTGQMGGVVISDTTGTTLANKKVRVDNYEIGSLDATVTAKVTLETGNWPTTVVPGQFIRLGAETALRRIRSVSGDEMLLTAGYPLSPDTGLVFAVTLKGSATDGTDPGCDLDTLDARLAGVVQDYTP